MTESAAATEELAQVFLDNAVASIFGLFVAGIGMYELASVLEKSERNARRNARRRLARQLAKLAKRKG